MTEDIAQLIELLDDDSTNIADDARDELMTIGIGVMQPLMTAVPRMRSYGQLSAIEIFEHLGEVNAAPVLIDLLDSENSTVREWSANALEQLVLQRHFEIMGGICAGSGNGGRSPDAVGANSTSAGPARSSVC
ncbi:HEAT repeat domain-containing protein, partial [Nonomuraea roseola]